MKYIQNIKKDSYVFCLDLAGKEFSSEQFSKNIENISMQSSQITFIIGGSLGLDKEVLNNADYHLCFSKMTFPHQLMQVILLEQIYRAYKINNNESYHK